jgi:hypothetical protein
MTEEGRSSIHCWVIRRYATLLFRFISFGLFRNDQCIFSSVGEVMAGISVALFAQVQSSITWELYPNSNYIEPVPQFELNSSWKTFDYAREMYSYDAACQIQNMFFWQDLNIHLR